MTTNDTGAGPLTDEEWLARHFRFMAAEEYAGSSAIYHRLGLELADRPDLTSPLLAAAPRQRRSLLYFAAIGYLLRTTATGHPLTAWMPTLGGTREAADGDPLAALADLVTAHRGEITTMCATRTTQTNEARRSVLLRPAFGRASELAGDRTLDLIELGTSAALLLVPDRYTHRYRRPDGETRSYGTGGPVLECELTGERWPDPAGRPLTIASRTGIDLNPIRWDDQDALTWLRSCIWPEHTDRAQRLDAAVAEVAAAAPRLIRGDLLAELPAVIAASGNAVPVVFSSHAVTYLEATARRDLVRRLDEIGRDRDLIFILNEGAPNMSRMFAPSVPETRHGVRTHVTIISWLGGTASVEVQAEGGAHGIWLDFNPRRYAYEPPALVTH